jgi:hypothetical protein
MTTLTKTLAFNTGRQYSENGQRIAAGLLDDGDILFVDIDRGLEYVIPAGAVSFTQAAIMAAYDKGDQCLWMEYWRPGHALVQQLSAAAAEAK